jgi:hypothetical protein
MLGVMEVAVRDRRELRSRNPIEEVVAVAELEAVDGLRRPLGLLGEARRRPVRGFNRRQRVGMRPDRAAPASAASAIAASNPRSRPMKRRTPSVRT